MKSNFFRPKYINNNNDIRFRTKQILHHGEKTMAYTQCSKRTRVCFVVRIKIVTHVFGYLLRVHFFLLLFFFYFFFSLFPYGHTGYSMRCLNNININIAIGNTSIVHVQQLYTMKENHGVIFESSSTPIRHCAFFSFRSVHNWLLCVLYLVVCVCVCR